MPSLENQNIIPQFHICHLDLFDVTPSKTKTLYVKPDLFAVTSPSPHLHIMSCGDADETSSGSRMRPHEKFTPDEDAKLMVLTSEACQTDWYAVAAQLPGRSARQCKDRWHKYLSPDIKRGAWTAAEDAVLRERYDEFGTKWARIAAFLPNRTDYMAKNRFAQLRRREQKSERKLAKRVPFEMAALLAVQSEPDSGTAPQATATFEFDPFAEFSGLYDGCGTGLRFGDDFW
jgi:hypothetical protein